MIPGSLGNALGLFFILAAIACWALAVWCATRGIRDVWMAICTGIRSETDSGTAAVLFASGFVLFMLFRVAVAS